MGAFIAGLVIGAFIWHYKNRFLKLVDKGFEQLGIDLIDDDKTPK